MERLKSIIDKQVNLNAGRNLYNEDGNQFLLSWELMNATDMFVGRYIEYAEKFMKILTSLKTGGSFYYAPALPFIEQYLDKTVYDIIGNQMDGGVLHSSMIKKLK